MISVMPAQPDAASLRPPSPAGTHSVVSWLMLVKEELLKELILLLLKSLERSKNIIVFANKEGLAPVLLGAVEPLCPHLLLTFPLGKRRAGFPCLVWMREHNGFAIDY